MEWLIIKWIWILTGGFTVFLLIVFLWGNARRKRRNKEFVRFVREQKKRKHQEKHD